VTSLRACVARFVSRRHPDIESLLDWAEGKTGPGIEAHLYCCRYCREHAALLRASLQDHAAIPLLEEVSEALLLRMRAFRMGPSNIAAALEHYFGKQAVRTLESSAHQPLFNTFLGRKAAEALTSRIAGVASV
jgi:hypothetical protein